MSISHVSALLAYFKEVGGTNTSDILAAYRADTVKLTEREELLVELLMLGQSNGQIATALGLSPSTIRTRLRCIFDKTGMSTRLELALWAQRRITRQ